MTLSQEFVDMLACPQCKGEIELHQDGTGLVCHTCRLKYPIREDIPIMLIGEAEKVDEE